MKKNYLFMISLFPFLAVGQSGTSGDPFTALGQAWNVSVSGTYYFNISGTSFSSYVEAGNGWILTASGSSATTEASYTVTSSLTLQSDRILSSTIYTATSVTDVRINATSGPSTPLDVQSSHSTIITNLRNNRTLSLSSTAAMWTGTSTARLSLGCASSNTTLNLGIYHSACNGSNLHWSVSQGATFEKIDLNDASKNDLNLWIRATSVPLSVDLKNFNTTLVNNAIHLDWQTFSETNNDYFVVERSRDGINWDELSSIKGQRNSSGINNYEFIDNNTWNGVSYYRLKLVDSKGQMGYSAIRSMYVSEESVAMSMYPNPTTEKLVIESNESEFKEIKVYDCFGKDISNVISITNETAHSMIIDVSMLSPGIYVVKTNTGVSTFDKR